MKLENNIYYTRGTRCAGPNIKFNIKKPAGQHGYITVGFSVKKYGYAQALKLAREAKADHLAKFDN